MGRCSDPFTWLTAAFAALSLSAFDSVATSALSAEMTGRVDKIVDGDTFWICDPSACHKIRLCGIDAPEIELTEGLRARAALTDLIDDQVLTCVPVGEGTVCDGRSRPTSHDRTVAQCFLGDADIAEAMVSSGHACDWVRYSGGHYSRGLSAAACRR